MSIITTAYQNQHPKTDSTRSSEHYGTFYIFWLQNVYSSHLQTSTATFLDLIGNYPPQIVPTIIVGDFNEDLLSGSTSFRVLQLMSSRGFSQLVQTPTTNFGSLPDHTYYNSIAEDAFVDVVDTYYSDHDATYHSQCDLIILMVKLH